MFLCHCDTAVAQKHTYTVKTSVIEYTQTFIWTKTFQIWSLRPFQKTPTKLQWEDVDSNTEMGNKQKDTWFDYECYIP